MNAPALPEVNWVNPEITRDIYWSAAQSRKGDSFLITRFVHDGRDLDILCSSIKAMILSACVPIMRCNESAVDWWYDERHCVTPGTGAGSVYVLDHRYTWRAAVTSSFDIVMFYVPLSFVDDISNDEEVARLEGPRKAVAFSPSDPVMYHLAKAVLPAIAHRTQANRLFTDHICSAAALHLATTYAGLRFHRSRFYQGGLAPWQERRAKEFIAANLHGNVGLQDLADLFGLSVTHFRRAFKASTGMTPHRWLMEQRIAKAQDLLANTTLSLAEIARAAGFYNQSHFSRAFSARIHVTPAAWRRMRRM